jgi:hypothetical protein
MPDPSNLLKGNTKLILPGLTGLEESWPGYVNLDNASTTSSSEQASHAEHTKFVAQYS